LSVAHPTSRIDPVPDAGAAGADTVLVGLTVVRFLAAFWVFLFHFNLRIPLDPGPVERIIANGALGMPLFFMLSGFVLAHRYHDRYEGFNAFCRARVARIYPAYLLSIVVALPFVMATKGTDLATLLFVIPVDLLLLQAWFPNLFRFWHHGGTWSISVEFFLYASFPLLRSIGQLTTRNILLVCIGSTLLAASFASSLRIGASADLPFPVFYSVPIYSLPAFAIGIALAALHRRGFRGFALAPLLLALVLAVAGHHNHRYAGLNFVTLPLIAASLLFAARVAATGPATLLVNRVTIYLGDISYPFFLFQIPLLMVLEYQIEVARSLPATLVFMLMLALNVALAAACHHRVEPWGRRLILRRWKV
jgi:peptidoglycan/LPS O-acetylase OafA/YrhL